MLIKGYLINWSKVVKNMLTYLKYGLWGFRTLLGTVKGTQFLQYPVVPPNCHETYTRPEEFWPEKPDGGHWNSLEIHWCLCASDKIPTQEADDFQRKSYWYSLFQFAELCIRYLSTFLIRILPEKQMAAKSLSSSRAGRYFQ